MTTPPPAAQAVDAQAMARDMVRRLNAPRGPRSIPGCELPTVREVSEVVAALLAERDSARAQVAALLASEARIREALEVYADPHFYHACAFMFDRPTGGFDEDFSYDDEYEREMPGKLARETLADPAPPTSGALLPTER